MKKILIRGAAFACCAAGALFLTGCTPHPTGTVQAVLPKDDITVSPELNAFIRNTPNMRVVLRVPAPRSDVTGEEHKQQAAGKNDSQIDLNSMYARIEKNLMKAGFVVRDRALLNNLIRNEQTNYADLGKKIETDIIIEIMKFDFTYAPHNEKTIRFDEDVHKDFKNHAVNGLQIERVSLDCKVIIVERGQTGAILTLNYTAEPYKFNTVLFEESALYGFNGDEPIYGRLNGNIERNKAIDYFSQRIAGLLKGR